ncbi:hypothetical protein EDD85DRAFT_787882 [Armillaria nabsnona]|nr:hypothetical protein EDD85DRAFT_787882 [Armillaria nabsnona]
MQSALVCLCKITDAGDGQQANTFMQIIINNLWTSIGSAPNPILSARYPTKLVGQHLLRWIKEFLVHNMSFYLSPHHRAAPTHEVLAGLQSLSFSYEAHGYRRRGPLSGHTRWRWVRPEDMYSAVLMPVLKVTSNRSIVSDWEACPNGGMVDKWESNDGGEEEGVSAVDLQAGHDFYSLELGDLCSADLPLRVADCSSFGIGNWLACNHTIVHHVWSSDPNEVTPSGISQEEDSGGLGLQGGPETPGKMLCKSPNWVKYDWLEKPEHSGLGHIDVPENQEACIFQLAEWRISTAECCKKGRVKSAQEGSSG